jgi:hypothetical protein
MEHNSASLEETLLNNNKTDYAEKDVSVNGFKIHFLEWGTKGQRIVILHGSWPWGLSHNLDHLSRPLSQDHPLTKLENVILTPHTAALTQECVIRLAKEAAKAINRLYILASWE